MAILRDVNRLLIVVQETKDVGRRRGVDNAASDELIHSLMVTRVLRVMKQTGPARVHAAGEEGDAEGLVVRDLLERAD